MSMWPRKFLTVLTATLIAMGSFSIETTASAQEQKLPVGTVQSFDELIGPPALNVQLARQLYRKILSTEPAPSRVQTKEVDADGVSCEWFWPARLHYRRGVRAILYVHGGGLFAGSSSTHRLIAGSMAKSASADLLAVNYRLLPDEDYSAPMDDVLSAYRWLLYSGYSPANIALVGDSFGATLAIAAVMRQIESGGALPATVVAMSPALELPETTAEDEAGDPLWRLSRNAAVEKAQRMLVQDIRSLPKSFPPLLVQTGEREDLFPGTSEYVARGQKNGLEISMTTWPGMMHGWQLFPDRFEAAKRSNQEAAAFIMHHLEAKSQD